MFKKVLTQRITQWLLIAIVAIGFSFICSTVSAQTTGAPIGGFLPMIGFGLTDEYETFDTAPDGSFVLTKPSVLPGGTMLGLGGTPHFELALLDSGAGTHILRSEAYDAFDIVGAGLEGTNTATIIGATGNPIEMLINDPMGFYVAGLGDRTASGSSIAFNPNDMRGQINVAALTAPTDWELPNIIGLPIVAQHTVAIRNDLPQIFEYQNRTVRTPQINFLPLGNQGTGQGLGGSDILRETNLSLQPGASFSTPYYEPNLDIDPNNPTFDFHDNPPIPTLVRNGAVTGAMFVDVRLTHEGEVRENAFFFDTGADLTVLSKQLAVQLGIDPILDTPDFVLEVEGAGGIQGGVPGFIVDELKLFTAGGSFVIQNVPVAVLDVPNPFDVGNVVPAILGMHVFVGRNIVIDANGAGGGGAPKLYISDPVTSSHTWLAASASDNWHTTGSWNTSGTPGELWVADAINSSGSHKTAVISSDSTVFQVNIGGQANSNMSVSVQTGATLTTFAHIEIRDFGELNLQGGSIDTQYIQLDGGVLTGEGFIFAGSGPIHGQVRNLAGTVAPGNGVGTLSLESDFSNRPNGILAIELGGTTAGTEHDLLAVDGRVFLGGELEVSLFDLGSGEFIPTIGDTFEILAATELLDGTFDTLNLPSNYTWNVEYDYNAFMVTLEVTGLAAAIEDADFDGDGDVDGSDFLAWQTGFGTTTGATLGDGDSDNDGDVDQQDFLVWQGSYGNVTTSSIGNANGVPEPSTLLLLIASMGIAMMHRWRK